MPERYRDFADPCLSRGITAGLIRFAHAPRYPEWPPPQKNSSTPDKRTSLYSFCEAAPERTLNAAVRVQANPVDYARPHCLVGRRLPLDVEHGAIDSRTTDRQCCFVRTNADVRKPIIVVSSFMKIASDSARGPPGARGANVNGCGLPAVTEDREGRGPYG